MKITFEEFIQKYLNQPCEVAGSANAKNQCVDLVNAYIREVLGFSIIEWTNAQDFPLKCLPPQYEFIKNTADNFPLKGDIPVWKSKDKVGHIGVCTEDGNKKTFKSFDQNWPLGSKCHIVKHSYKEGNFEVIGWLRCKSIPFNSNAIITDDQKRALEIISKFQIEAKHGNLEGAANAAVGAVKENEKNLEKISELQGNISELTKTIEKLNDKIGQYQELATGYQSELLTAKESLGTMTTDRNSKWTQYKDKNDEFNALKTIISDPVYLIYILWLMLRKKSVEKYLLQEIPKIIKNLKTNEQT